jgi:protocatechuate 4,5-dioxygenase alpha chain
VRHRLYPLSDLEDIPGTTVFTARRSRQAYHLHKFCMSLMEADNRSAFKADERAYLDKFRMSEEQKAAVLERDFSRLVELGGNIYFLVKLSNTDGWSAQQAVGSMTDLTPDEYAEMMRGGGRSPEGLKSKREQLRREIEDEG